MPFKTIQLALAAAPQRLSNAYGGASLGNTVNPAQDIPWKQVHLQSEAAVTLVGDSSALSASAYGYSIASGGTVMLGPFDDGPIKLSDIWVAGAGATLHVTGVPL